MEGVTFTFLVIGVFLLLFFILLIYSGLFRKAVIVEGYGGPYKIVYEEHIGPYEKIGKIQDKVYGALKKDGINSTKGIGIYYNNPKEIEKSKLKSDVGCVIEKKDYKKLAKFEGHYSIRDIKKKKYAIVEFPLRNKLSIIFGAMKVYPEFRKYFDENGYPALPAIELYDIPAGKIIYLRPIK